MIKLEVTKLKKTFGDKEVFTDISLLQKGGLLGIAGANGSGKSTFLKCIAGLLRPTYGSIMWAENGEPLTSKQFKKKLGYAAPYINLYDELTCYENLLFLANVRHEKDNKKKKISHWIEKVGISHVAKQPFGKLSTGQQQRLRLASALFHNPDILLLDEPGSNLDDAGRRVISDIVDDFAHSEKLLILASNNPEELKLCNNSYSIEKGERID